MILFILNKDAFSKKIYQLAQQTGKYSEILYLDDFCKDEDVVDFMNDFVLHISDDNYFFAGFENDNRRCEWLNKLMELGANIATIIAPDVQIHPTARILPGCLIESNVTIGAKCLIKTGSYLKEGTTVKDGEIIEKNGMSISHISGH